MKNFAKELYTHTQDDSKIVIEMLLLFFFCFYDDDCFILICIVCFVFGCFSPPSCWCFDGLQCHNRNIPFTMCDNVQFRGTLWLIFPSFFGKVKLRTKIILQYTKSSFTLRPKLQRHTHSHACTNTMVQFECTIPTKLVCTRVLLFFFHSGLFWFFLLSRPIWAGRMIPMT